MPFQFRKEAIEEDLNSNFPSQGQGNPPLYYSLSEVVVPTYSINQSAEGSQLPVLLQNAWDFSTIDAQANNNTVTVANVPGFYKCQLVIGSIANAGADTSATLAISDGLTSKPIFDYNLKSAAGEDPTGFIDNVYVFLRSGDSLTATTNNSGMFLDVKARQVAQVNGTLIDPLGYSAA